MKKAPLSNFEILQDIIYIVDKNKVKKITVIGNPDTNGNKKKSKIELLYEGLHYKTFATDTDAAAALGYKGEKDTAYIKLKHELKKRLLNTILFIDTDKPHFSDLERARFSAKHDWITLEFLLLRGGRRSGLQLAEELFALAEKFEITLIALDIAKKLMTNFALDGVKRKYEYYKAAIERLIFVYNAETEAELLCTKFVSANATNKSHKPELYQLGVECLAYLSKYENVKSIVYLSFYGVIERNMYDGKKDFRKIIEVCEKNNALIKEKPFLHKAPIVINLYNIAAAHIVLREYAQAQATINEYLQYLEVGHTTWFKGIDIQITLFFHTGQVDKGYTLYEKGKAERSFGQLYRGDQERWTLYSGYF
jgi:hypothetical protein